MLYLSVSVFRSTFLQCVNVKHNVFANFVKPGTLHGLLNCCEIHEALHVCTLNVELCERLVFCLWTCCRISGICSLILDWWHIWWQFCQGQRSELHRECSTVLQSKLSDLESDNATATRFKFDAWWCTTLVSYPIDKVMCSNQGVRPQTLYNTVSPTDQVATCGGPAHRLRIVSQCSGGQCRQSSGFMKSHAGSRIQTSTIQGKLTELYYVLDWALCIYVWLSNDNFWSYKQQFEFIWFSLKPMGPTHAPCRRGHTRSSGNHVEVEVVSTTVYDPSSDLTMWVLQHTPVSRVKTVPHSLCPTWRCMCLWVAVLASKRLVCGLTSPERGGGRHVCTH